MKNPILGRIAFYFYHNGEPITVNWMPKKGRRIISGHSFGTTYNIITHYGERELIYYSAQIPCKKNSLRYVKEILKDNP